VVYSSIHDSMTDFASRNVVKLFNQIHPSFSIRMKRSIAPFCSGEYGVMYSGSRPYRFTSFTYRLEPKMSPLPLLQMTPMSLPPTPPESPDQGVFKSPLRHLTVLVLAHPLSHNLRVPAVNHHNYMTPSCEHWPAGNAKPANVPYRSR
jgi:hypothetical protein